MPPVIFTDQSGPTPGTSLSAANINSLAAADTSEASTMDTLGGSSTWINNLDRLRNQLGVVIGGVGSAWNAAVQMIPLSQKGAPNGVASLNASTKVPLAQLALNGTPSSPAAVVATDSANVADLSGSATAATATAGLNGATPAQVAGYFQLYVTHNGTRTSVRVPYYLP